MKSQIQQLIAAGRTKEAIDLMARSNTDALLFGAQYNNGLKQFNLGIIESREWQRIQDRLNWALLDTASRMNDDIVIQNVISNNLIYVNYIVEQDKPGNELALFNRMFRTLEQMIDDQDYPLEDLGEIVQALNRHIGMPELVDAFEEFGKTAYKGNTEAYKTQARKGFVQSLLEIKAEVLNAIRDIVTEKQKETGWKEAWTLLLQDPSPNRWANTRQLIDARVTDAIFTDEQAEKWGALSAQIDAIPASFMWKHHFTKSLPDLKKWVTENLH